MSADKSDNMQRVMRIKKYLEEESLYPLIGCEKELLDIGAGMGVFPYKFLDETWRGTILEPDSVACDHMRTVIPGATVICGDLRSASLRKKFDLITMNRVLEHIADPIACLRRASSVTGS